MLDMNQWDGLCTWMTPMTLGLEWFLMGHNYNRLSPVRQDMEQRVIVLSWWWWLGTPVENGSSVSGCTGQKGDDKALVLHVPNQGTLSSESCKETAPFLFLLWALGSYSGVTIIKLNLVDESEEPLSKCPEPMPWKCSWYCQTSLSVLTKYSSFLPFPFISQHAVPQEKPASFLLFPQLFQISLQCQWVII